MFWRHEDWPRFWLSRMVLGWALINWCDSFPFVVFKDKIYLECLSTWAWLISILLINLVVCSVQMLILKTVVQIHRIVILFVCFFWITVETILSTFPNRWGSAYAMPLSMSIVNWYWLAFYTIVSQQTFIVICISIPFSSGVRTWRLETFALLCDDHYKLLAEWRTDIFCKDAKNYSLLK